MAFWMLCNRFTIMSCSRPYCFPPPQGLIAKDSFKHQACIWYPCKVEMERNGPGRIRPFLWIMKGGLAQAYA